MSKTAIRLNVEKQTLANGSTLLYKHLPGAPRLAVSIFLPGGNQLDTVPGLSDIVDRLVPKGTKTRNKEQISIAIDGLSLEVDTDTKRDYSTMVATLLDEDLDASFELMADLFYNALLSETEFLREKEKISGEVFMDLDAPRNRASDLFVRTIFGNTPYATVSSVLLENLPKLTDVNTIRAHYHNAYRTERAVVTVVGDAPLSRISKKLEEYFPASKPNGNIQVVPGVAALKDLRIAKNQMVSFARDDSSQAHIFKGWLVPDAKHPDYAAMAVLNTILGAAGLSSRLFVELRDKQGLAYNVRSSYETFQHKGMFYLYIGTEPSNKEKCLKGFITECQKLIDTAVGEKELADAKRNILGKRAVFLETASQQANYIGANYLMGRTLEEVEALPEQIAAVSAKDVQRVAQYLTEPAVTAVVGPSAIL